jgi:hypothetical protein
VHEWRLHAYVIMRNHFHLALETPQANLVEGMHWLLSTFSTRFNRFREERGHLFAPQAAPGHPLDSPPQGGGFAISALTRYVKVATRQASWRTFPRWPA